MQVLYCFNASFREGEHDHGLACSVDMDLSFLLRLTSWMTPWRCAVLRTCAAGAPARRLSRVAHNAGFDNSTWMEQSLRESMLSQPSRQLLSNEVILSFLIW